MYIPCSFNTHTHTYTAHHTHIGFTPDEESSHELRLHCNRLLPGIVHLTCREHTQSHHITPHHITPHHTTSHHITPHHITPHHITSPHTTSHHTTSHHITHHTCNQAHTTYTYIHPIPDKNVPNAQPTGIRRAMLEKREERWRGRLWISLRPHKRQTHTYIYKTWI